MIERLGDRLIFEKQLEQRSLWKILSTMDNQDNYIELKTMPTLEEIKKMIFQLPIQEPITLMEDLEEKLETLMTYILIKCGWIFAVFKEFFIPQMDRIVLMTSFMA